MDFLLTYFMVGFFHWIVCWLWMMIVSENQKKLIDNTTHTGIYFTLFWISIVYDIIYNKLKNKYSIKDRLYYHLTQGQN